jgi:delta-aminolevulinic acid dehydratase/porphobilinogen synthase
LLILLLGIVLNLKILVIARYCFCSYTRRCNCGLISNKVDVVAFPQKYMLSKPNLIKTESTNFERME